MKLYCQRVYANCDHRRVWEMLGALAYVSWAILFTNLLGIIPYRYAKLIVYLS